MVAILLLAAGCSSRMDAGNKLLLPFGGQTLLEATLTELEMSGLGNILVITGHQASEVCTVLHGRPHRLVENPDYRTGMSSSIRAGIIHAEENTDGFMICLADMPLIPATVYRHLADAFASFLAHDPRAIVQPRFQHRRGHPVLFSAAYRTALQTLRFPEGAREILQENPQHLYTVDVDTDAILLDADTAEGYRLLLERLHNG